MREVRLCSFKLARDSLQRPILVYKWIILHSLSFGRRFLAELNPLFTLFPRFLRLFMVFLRFPRFSRSRMPRFWLRFLGRSGYLNVGVRFMWAGHFVCVLGLNEMKCSEMQKMKKKMRWRWRIFQSFGCLICEKWKMNDNGLYICEVISDVMIHNDSSLKICTFCGKT